MRSVLAQMRQSSLARLLLARAKESERELWRRVLEMSPAPSLQLSEAGFDCIAELKLQSPSVGDLSQHTVSLEERVRSYALGGACAVSVLTEPTRFGGSLEHLRAAARVLEPYAVPTLRKDFLLDPYQVMEARASGAGGVLLIARLLTRTQLTALLDCAAQLHMFVLLETFDAEDAALVSEVLTAGAQAGEVLVGVNCRDLGSLAMSPAHFAAMASLLPPGYVHVAESGIADPAVLPTLVAHGYRMVLVGTALMRTCEPIGLLQQLIAAGRAPVSAASRSQRRRPGAPAASSMLAGTHRQTQTQ